METHNVLFYGWHQKNNEKHFNFPFWDFPTDVPTFRLEKTNALQISKERILATLTTIRVT